MANYLSKINLNGTEIELHSGSAGTTQIPVTATPAVMQAMYNVYKSYLINENDLVRTYWPAMPTQIYSDIVFPFTDYTKTLSKVNGMYCINDITLILMMLFGIPFEASSYVRENTYKEIGYDPNCQGYAGYQWNWGLDRLNPDNIQYINSIDNLKTFCDEIGIYKTTSTWYELSMGDIVFCTDTLGVERIGIVMKTPRYQVTENYAYLATTINTETNPYYIGIDKFTNITGYARPQYTQPSLMKYPCIYSPETSSTVGQLDFNIGERPRNKSIIYTLTGTKEESHVGFMVTPQGGNPDVLFSGYSTAYPTSALYVLDSVQDIDAEIEYMTFTGDFTVTEGYVGTVTETKLYTTTQV